MLGGLRVDAMIKISSMIYMAIIMGMVIFGLLSFVGSMATSYGKTADLSSINKTIQLGNQIKSSYQTFQTDNPSFSVLGSTGMLIMGANFIWKFIILFLQVPELIVSMVTDLVTAMGIPAEYIGGIYLLVIAGAILGIFYYLGKVEP